MKKVNLKVAFIFFIGVFAMGAILLFSKYAKNYFVESNKLLHKLNYLQKLDNELNYEVLSSSFYLYYNNDIIASTIHKMDKSINELENMQFFKDHYRSAYNEFLQFENLFSKKESLIFEYLRFSFPLKNSLIYLSNSLNLMNIDTKTGKNVLKVLSNLFLAKSAIDTDFIKNINLKQLAYLKNSKDPYKVAFYNNLKIFITYFPVYKKYLSEILNYPTKEVLEKVNNELLSTIKHDLKVFDVLSYLLAGFIAFLIFSISIAIIKLENYIKELSYVLTHDVTTGLFNRYKFNQDIKNKNEVAVAVFNIDKFKNINDYFGNGVGDIVLKQVGKNFEAFFEYYNIPVYRIGADDFAVIFEKWDKEKIVLTVEEAINTLESQVIIIDDTPFSFTFSAGISFSPPYLEKADIALKYVKKSVMNKIGIYNEFMNKEIELNIKKTKEIKEAIENGKIYPYFQPIFDADKNVIKYEVLCRVDIGGEIKSIYPYLKLLKEIKLYHLITKTILKKSYEVLKSNPSVSLSVNLSVEDLMSSSICSLMDSLFVEEDITRRLTFEILESEIVSYDIVFEFIRKYKQRGVSFAIDDFGSGYSNFHRILKMDIDYLKIDGSLIKDIDTDETSKNVVETIVALAKKSNKKTVAEYIHSKSVFEVCKQIGIDYFQGFYLAKPSPKLLNVKKV